MEKLVMKNKCVLNKYCKKVKIEDNEIWNY